jgi:hypothetical protein
MSTTAFFGMLAGALALLEIYPYTMSILGRGLLLRRIPEDERTIPNLATWTILSMAGGIIAFSYYERNDLDGFWFFGGLFLGYCMAAILSIRYGEHRRNSKPPFSTLDKICIAGASVGLVIWYLSGSWEIPIAVNIIVDGFGIAPTIEKVWRLPRSESLQAWTMTVLACVFSIVALGPVHTWNFDRAAFPIYMMLGSGIVWVLLFLRFRK